MPALVAGIHVFTAVPRFKTWMAGTGPAMTKHSRGAACARGFVSFPSNERGGWSAGRRNIIVVGALS
jgi:hypothetical protein